MPHEPCRSLQDTARQVRHIDILQSALAIFRPTFGADPKIVTALHLYLCGDGKQGTGSFLGLLESSIKTRFAYIIRLTNLVEQIPTNFLDLGYLTHETDPSLCYDPLFLRQLWR